MKANKQPSKARLCVLLAALALKDAFAFFHLDSGSRAFSSCMSPCTASRYGRGQALTDLTNPVGCLRSGPNGRTTHPSSTSIRRATVKFDGESSTSIFVPFPENAAGSNRTLPEWLLRAPESSDGVLLGTDEFRARTDGMYESFQPGVDWFGLELVPVFVSRIDRSEDGPGSVTVRIVDARSDIRSGGNGPAGKVIRKVMEKSTFKGRYGVAWRTAPRRKGSRDGWTLSADLALTLVVPLPDLIPLPPGFNRIGSSIVKSTCSKRVEKNLEDLRDAYLVWSRQPEKSLL